MFKSRSWNTLFFFLSFIIFSHRLLGVTVVVNDSTDTGGYAGNGAGTMGDLRYCLNYINGLPAGVHTLEFSGAMSITLSRMLPVVNLFENNTLTINSTSQNVTLDGNNSHRGFLISQGTVTIQDMTIQNCNAQGGNGGQSAGGGGMGAGSAILNDQANLTLSNITLSNCQATGGNGGQFSSNASAGGGGGGMGGNGGVGRYNGFAEISSAGGGGGIGNKGVDGRGGAGGQVLGTDNSDGGNGGGGGLNGDGGAGGNATGFVPGVRSAHGAGGGLYTDGGTGAPTGLSGGTRNGESFSTTFGGGGGGGRQGSSSEPSNQKGPGGVGGNATCTPSGSEFGGSGGAGGGCNGNNGGAGGDGGGGGGGGGVSGAQGGAGGIGGGGGAGEIGGNGGFGGGGGGGGNFSGQKAGDGGFGGGGGGGSSFGNTSAAGKGGFGGGGGGTRFKIAGDGGFGGGTGGGNSQQNTSTVAIGGGWGNFGGGGGGAAFGGPIFSNTGTLTIIGDSSIPTSTLTGGLGGNNGINPKGGDGVTAGKSIFALADLVLNPASLETITVTDSISDGSLNSVPATGSSTPGSNGNAIQLIKMGLGTAVLQGVNTFLNGVNLQAGTLNINANAALGATSAALNTTGIATLQLAATIPDMSRAIMIANTETLTVDTNTFNLTESGIISGMGSLGKTGMGTVFLQGTNTYSGGTILQEGTVNINASAALGFAAAPLNVTGSGILQLAATIPSMSRAIMIATGESLTVDTNSFNLTQMGIISGMGTLEKTSAGTLFLQGINTYSGGTNLDEGILNINSNAALGDNTGDLNATGSATLQLAATIPSMSRNVVISPTETLTIDTNTFNLTESGIISGPMGILEKTGTGTLFLQGVNTYSGGTNLDEGILNINANAALGDNAGDLNTTGSATLQLAATIAAMSRNMVISPTETLTIDTNTFNLTESGIISGPMGILEKTGTGTLFLQGVNTYSGGTNLDEGIININADTALGNAAGPLNAVGSGTLQLAASIPGMTRNMVISPTETLTIDTNTFDLTESGIISGAMGILEKTGTGTLFLQGINTYSGGTNLDEGILNINADTGLGNAAGPLNAVGSGTLQLAATIPGMTRNVVISPTETLTIDTNTFDLTESGIISGAMGILEKTGMGTLFLQGVNTYSGGTNLNEGILDINSNAALGDNAGDLNATGSATLELAASIPDMSRNVVISSTETLTIDTNTFDLTESGIISGPMGILEKTGTGTLFLQGVNTYSGGTNLDEGILNINSNAALGDNAGDLNATGSATLQLAATIAAMSRDVVISPTETLTIDTNTFNLTESGIISGPMGILEKTGGGTLFLQGVNTYSGGTNLDEGIININSNAALGDNAGDLNATGSATLQLAATIPAMSRDVVISPTETLTIDTNTFNLSESGIISGPMGILEKTGTGTLFLQGVNTYSGGTNLDEGILNINADTALGNAAAPLNAVGSGTLQLAASIPGMTRNMVISPNETLTIDTNTFDLTESGIISGAMGVLEKTGTGTLFLQGINTYSGGTNLDEGILNINADTGLGNAAGPLNAVGSGTLQLAATIPGMTRNVMISPAETLTIDTNTFDLTESGIISGAMGILEKTGMGTLFLQGVNTYSGGTNLNEGILDINSNAALGDNAGDLNATGSATLELAATIPDMSRNVVISSTETLTIDTNTFDLTESGIISGPMGILEKTGTGTLFLQGVNTYSGGTNLDEGILNINSNAALGDNAGDLNATGSATLQLAATIAAMSRDVVISPTETLTIDTNTFNLTESGIISGPMGILEKTGGGTLFLQGVNTYSGGTNLDEGIININSNAALGDNAGDLNATGSATLQLAATIPAMSRNVVISPTEILTIDTNTFNLTESGIISGPMGILEKTGGGTLFLQGVNTYSGGTNLDQGILNINADTALGNAAGPLNAVGSGTLQLAASIPGMTRNMVISPNETLTIDTNTFDLIESGMISGLMGILEKTGAGTLFLQGANTYSGGTTLEQGIININADAALGDPAGPLNVTGSGTLQLAATIPGMTRGMMIANGETLTIDTNGFDLTESGIISGDGSLLKTGPGVLTVPSKNTYTGGTTLEEGTIAIKRNRSLGPPGTTLDVTGDSTLQLTRSVIAMQHKIDIDATKTLTIDTQNHLLIDFAAISGGGALTKEGTGKLILFNTTNTYTGDTNVDDGLLFLIKSSLNGNVFVNNSARFRGVGKVTGNVSVNDSASIRAGTSIGTINITGNLTLSPLSTTIIEINDEESSLINVTGTANLGLGNLTIFANPGFYKEQKYTILTASSLLGTTFNPAVVFTGQPINAQVVYFPTFVRLSLIGPQPPPQINLALINNCSGKKLANYLNQFGSDPGLGPVVGSLVGLSPDDLNAAINSISPARNAISTFVAQNTMFLMNRTIFSRISQYRLKQNDPSMRLGAFPDEAFKGFSSEVASNTFKSAKNQMIETNHSSTWGSSFFGNLFNPFKNRKKSASQSNEASQGTMNALSPFAFWAEGFGEFIDQKSQTQIPGYSSTAAGALLGLDYYGRGNGLVGAAVGYARNWIDQNRNLGGGDIDFYAANVYGTIYIGNGYIELGVSGAANRFSNERHVEFYRYNETSRSNYWGGVAVPHLSGGYDFNFDWGVIEPFASADLAILYHESFSEEGPGVLNMRQKSSVSELLRTEVGLHAYEIWKTQYGNFIFCQTLSYVNKEPFDVGEIEAAVVGYPFGFTVQDCPGSRAFSQNQSFFSPGVQVYYEADNGVFCSVLYMGEFQWGSSRYMSNNILGKIGVYF